MKLLLLALFAALLMQTTGIQSGKLTHHGLERDYRLYIPTSYDPAISMPLLMALHPAGGDAELMARISNFDDFAETYGFLVVYPQGKFGYWDYGAGLPGWENVPRVVDDPGFLGALLEQLRVDYNISQIYVTGFSSGARMAFRMGCEYPDQIAGIAPVAATISDEVTGACAEAMNVELLYLHGTRDGVTPWAGKPLYENGVMISTALSAPDTAAFWAARNGCTVDRPTVTYETVATWTVGEAVYQDCRNGQRVVFDGIERGGHEWFRRENFDASTRIVEFFFGENENTP